MSAINIRRDVSDKFYRYKMPKLLAKVEGKGNGIKTVLPNMADIAKSLSRPPMFPTKFFGCELGAQVKYDAANDRYIINGAHDADKLQTILDGFIDKFVLCISCKNPETDLHITKDEVIMRDCKACGAVGPVDMRHKLIAYILKNPPVTAKKSKADKKSKKAGRSTDAIPTPTETNSNGSGEDDGDDELTRQIEEGVKSLPVAPEADDDDEDWAEDTTEDAVAKRMMELNVSGAVSKLMDEADDDEANDGDDPIEQFADSITEGGNSDADIVAKAKELGIRDHKACAVLAQVLFDNKVMAQKQIPKRAALLRQFAKNEKSQKAILGGIERLVGIAHPELLAKTALILKALYDEEIVEEDVFLSWGDKPSKKYVDKKLSKEIRSKAEPFLNWLREADEDDDEDSDDE
ncbi:domain found in IF2B/IF5-domain-containing protein [Entophlyctis helioformis]|nr:domain found in IF2B/IF5-domain-containing protein [Entophlyctis helioformis]